MPTSFDGELKRKLISAEEAAARVKSGDWVEYGFGLGQPDLFDHALAERVASLERVKIRGCLAMRPRADHVSAGIAGKMGETTTAELRRILERWLEEHWLQENGLSLDAAGFYSHILPSFRAQTFDKLEVCEEGWAMIGDSAGLVDPITGEGLYYALRSAELCANALLLGRPDEYRTLLEEEILSELKLAARVSQRFYNGQIFGGSVLERMVSLTAQSASFRELMSDLFAGIQGYRDLRSRLYRILPAVMAEGLAGTMSWSWNKSAKFATDPFAE